MFDHPSFDAHEGVHMFHDSRTGLRAIIAVHSTHLGPAAGGCRMWNYETGEGMLRDALRLSQGMSYKNAMAGLPLGGGKGVIWGNSKTGKTPELFQAFGRAVESLKGKYYTAEDVGIDVADMAEAARETSYVAGLDTGEAASGDPSPVTALGVFRGIKVCAERVYGSDDLNNRTVAVQGVGSVGGGVCELLAEAGARLIIADIDEDAPAEVKAKTGARIVAADEIYDVEAEIFSPNALGAIVNETTIDRLQAKIIAGGANNQLATPQLGEALREKGVLFAPDYVINGGGIINVAAEISGEYSREWVDGKLDALMESLGAVLDEALSSGQATNKVANAIAARKIGRG